MAVDQRKMDNIQHIPILAVFGRLTLDFREASSSSEDLKHSWK